MPLLDSPANKDRPESHRGFAAKCAAYLGAGIGLVIVDVVTSRNANLHHKLLELLGQVPESRSSGQSLYAVAYHPVKRDGQDELDLWSEQFSIGDLLPQLPLGIGPKLFVPVDLEAAYVAACRRRRL